MECMNSITFTTPRTIPRAESMFTFMSPRSKQADMHVNRSKPILRNPPNKTHKTCLYRTGKCNMPRHIKANGSLHKMCTFHRSKANENQRRLDQKKKDAGFHRRERITAFKIKGVLQPKASILMMTKELNEKKQQPQYLYNMPSYEDILPDVMIPFILDSYTDVSDDTSSNSSFYSV